MVDYKENAAGGDEDGFVQSTTPLESPIEKVEEPVVVEEKPVVAEKVEKPTVDKKPSKKTDVTCVTSKRNLFIPNVGRLIKGKNEIDPAKADIYLAVDGVEAC
jgi:hypothetical protein